jgi:hypothetical protein
MIIKNRLGPRMLILHTKGVVTLATTLKHF